MKLRQQPQLRCDRAKSDEALSVEIRRVWEASRGVYGYRKVWHQLRREGIQVARCTVSRLMSRMGLQGVVRGRRPTTTTPRLEQERPIDLVQRDFTADAPNKLWVADLTYVGTRLGFAFVAFITDVFSRRIVGWRVASTMKTCLALDALEQAIHQREVDGHLVHHSDRGSQYLSIRYTDRLREVGIESSVGSVGDSYDNALAETINGLFKAEVIRHLGPWENVAAVELATARWVCWYNNERLYEALGYRPPAEFEADFYNSNADQQMAA